MTIRVIGNECKELQMEDGAALSTIRAESPIPAQVGATVKPLLFAPITSSSKTEWIGFLQSVTGDKNRRHKAKCKACGVVLDGRIKFLEKTQGSLYRDD